MTIKPKYICDECSTEHISSHIPNSWTEFKAYGSDGFRGTVHLCLNCSRLMKSYRRLVNLTVEKRKHTRTSTSPTNDEVFCAVITNALGGVVIPRNYHEVFASQVISEISDAGLKFVSTENDT